MADKWTVNEGTQVAYGDKMHAAGATFSATAEEVEAEGLTPYVTKVRQQSAPKADNKAQAAPKADNKAQAAPAPQAQAKDSGDRKS